jgi:Fe-S-cluster containining protein
MKSIEKVDFPKACTSCGYWCCHNERPFASASELERLGVEKIETREDGACSFLGADGNCTVYEKRPLECRIFPFDFEERDGVIHWMVWDSVCPARPLIDVEKSLEHLERVVMKGFDEDYVRGYLDYYLRVSEPASYIEGKWTLLRKVRFLD